MAPVKASPHGSAPLAVRSLLLLSCLPAALSRQLLQYSSVTPTVTPTVTQTVTATVQPAVTAQGDPVGMSALDDPPTGQLPGVTIPTYPTVTPQPAVTPAQPPAQPDAPGPIVCTPWSWQLCKDIGGGVYQVQVDAEGGGGMQAPGHFLNGIFSMDIKLPPGNSGGVNFAWYLMDTTTASNKDERHCEIDVEMYGGRAPDRVLLALNVFAQGKQNLAQFSLPFDPSLAFHTFTMKWNADQIVWLLDGEPIRVLNREEGKPWPKFSMKPMASVWATPWTPLQANYSNGPITAYFTNYQAQGCPATSMSAHLPGVPRCAGPWNEPLTAAEMGEYQAMYSAHVIKDYGWDDA